MLIQTKKSKTINYKENYKENYKINQLVSPNLISSIDVNKIVVSNKVSFGKKDFKYFIGFKDAKKSDLSA